MESYEREYKDYIIDHKANVEKAYRWLKDHNKNNEIDFGNETKADILIKQHDLSKWSEEEFSPYALYFYVDKDKYKEEFDKAWNHHQKVNPHHWQYWVLINDDEGTHALKMPQEYVIEMICDWWSFSHKINKLDEIFNWYSEHIDKQILHPETRAEVEKILAFIKKELEKE